MRFTVEPWAPDYGTPGGLDLPPAEPEVDLAVEAPPDRWEPIRPGAEPASSVLFVDGVRRVDAGVWIEQDDGAVVLGLCASYAAGAVRCAERAEVVGWQVERGLFTSAREARTIVTAHGGYPVRATPGQTAEELWLGIQRRMGELEGEVAVDGDTELVVVDGPLSHHRHLRRAVGYVKAQHVRYLPVRLARLLGALPVGRRTPLFLIGGRRPSFSWYLRLAVGAADHSGLVRCEITADRSPNEAARLADEVSATLPRFASDPHKDPRAPQNLYPVGGLERRLRRLLGDHAILYRALRAAAR